MPRIGVSITKSTSFRGSTQEFSNVYYYEMATLPSSSAADTIIDNLTTLEKTFHATTVTFVRGRVWSQTGSPSTNEMITQKNLSGTGARATVAGLDKERAFLFKLRAGVDSRGNPVYLRKWYHACGVFFSGQTVGSGILDNTTAFSSGDKTSMIAAMNGIGDANGSSGVPQLCAKGGRQPGSGQTWTSHNYLEHHQLGDMWRAQ
jgi:hypothetical protein